VERTGIEPVTSGLQNPWPSSGATASARDFRRPSALDGYFFGPGEYVLLKPNWSWAEARYWSGEVRSRCIAGCSPPTDAKQFRDLGETGQP